MRHWLTLSSKVILGILLTMVQRLINPESVESWNAESSFKNYRTLFRYIHRVLQIDGHKLPLYLFVAFSLSKSEACLQTGDVSSFHQFKAKSKAS